MGNGSSKPETENTDDFSQELPPEASALDNQIIRPPINFEAIPAPSAVELAHSWIIWDGLARTAGICYAVVGGLATLLMGGEQAGHALEIVVESSLPQSGFRKLLYDISVDPNCSKYLGFTREGHPVILVYGENGPRRCLGVILKVWTTGEHGLPESLVELRAGFRVGEPTADWREPSFFRISVSYPGGHYRVPVLRARFQIEHQLRYFNMLPEDEGFEKSLVLNRLQTLLRYATDPGHWEGDVIGPFDPHVAIELSHTVLRVIDYADSCFVPPTQEEVDRWRRLGITLNADIHLPREVGNNRTGWF